ncbi:MAG TPA: cyclase family protein, partial [Pseudolysinimonas sp.]|nr:cyclase family protein [Pseudolysinimonas sp.]
GPPALGITDDAVYMPLQASTQWDALCHIVYRGRAYNDRSAGTVTSQGAERNSITNLRDRAVGRGVLLDIPRMLGREWLDPGEAIQSEHLAACADWAGVDVREGDFLLVRTGQIAERRSSGSWGDYAGGPAPGLGVGAAEFVCERGVVAVATDTWGIEVIPYETAELRAPLHVILLVHAGIYIGEMWDLEALAADCAADGRWEFLLSAPPLTITGAVGSPLNPIAIK